MKKGRLHTEGVIAGVVAAAAKPGKGKKDPPSAGRGRATCPTP